MTEMTEIIFGFLLGVGVSGPLQSVDIQQDVIYFLIGMINSVQKMLDEY